jgi:hypothetical protein
LTEATKLIARQFASAHPATYPDEASATDSARRQLLLALFEGAVYSEGVLWSGPPTADDPNEPPPLPEPSKWEQIDAGWWSHERYEEYVIQHDYTLFQDLLPKGEAVKHKDVPRSTLPERQILKDTNLLDRIVVSWHGSDFYFEGFEWDHGYLSIRVRRSDIETHFAIGTAELCREEIGQPAAEPANSEMRLLTETDINKKRKTKPDPVRTAVHIWLDERLRERGRHWLKSQFDAELGRLYVKTLSMPPGDPGHVRKIIAAWRKQSGLTRMPKPNG